MSDRQENDVVNEATVDQEFTVIIFGKNLAPHQNLMNVNTLERCFSENIDKEKGIFIETVEDRIQNAILTAIDSINTRKIEFAVMSRNPSSWQDSTVVLMTLQRDEEIGITTTCENVSERNSTLHVFNTNNESQENIPDEVSELSVRGTHFDRQSHTHHNLLRVCFRRLGRPIDGSLYFTTTIILGTILVCCPVFCVEVPGCSRNSSELCLDSWIHKKLF